MQTFKTPKKEIHESSRRWKDLPRWIELILGKFQHNPHHTHTNKNLNLHKTRGEKTPKIHETKTDILRGKEDILDWGRERVMECMF